MKSRHKIRLPIRKGVVSTEGEGIRERRLTQFVQVGTEEIEIEVDLNLDRLAQLLGEKAARTKAGKSAMAFGCAKARVLSRAPVCEGESR